MRDHQYPEEIAKVAMARLLRPKGCAACHHSNLDRNRKNFLCIHPDMQSKRFDVTAYMARWEFPARCPLVGVQNA